MKKTITKIGLLLSLTLPLSLSAQTIFSESFNGPAINTTNAWTQFNEQGTVNWVIGTFSGTSFAKISGYVNSANTDSKTWLISPAMDLSSAVDLKMSFTNTSKFAGPDLQILISTNYDGVMAVTSAQWDDISTLATLETEEAGYSNPFLSSGEMSLSTYNQTNVHIAFKYTSTTTEGSTWEIDNVLLFNGTVTPPTPISISSVQATSSGDEADMVGQDVFVGGRVSGIVATKGFYIQDGVSTYSGIYVYDLGVNNVAIGDSVLVAGTVDEFAFNGTIGSSTQITNITLFENKGAYTAYPAVDLSTLAVNDEKYESMLVKVTNAVTTTIVGGNFFVNDGTGEIKIDKFMFIFPFPVANTYYESIKGIVGHGYEEFKIYPRMSSDLVISPFNAVSEINKDIIGIYPNEVSSVLTIANANGVDATIISVEGKEMSKMKITSNVYDVNVATYPSGVYFLQVNSQAIKFVKK